MVSEEDNEKMTPGMMGRLEKMMEEALARMGIQENKEDIVVQCGSVRLRIYEAGDYPSKENPAEKIKFEAGIELRQGGLRLHLEASDLAQLIFQCRNHPDASTKLTERLRVEQQLMTRLGFK